MRAWFGYYCVALGLVACGPKQEAKAPAPKPVAAAPVVVEEPPDLSPLKRPDEVVVVGRIARPRAFVETLAQWSSVPLRLEDMMPADARPLARAVLWEAPVEMLVALDTFGEGKLPPPLIVGSVGLKSLDEALSAAESMQMPTRKVAPGVFRVGDFAETSCAIAVSLGAAPARLVCGKGARDVDTLLPYATRGLANEPQTGADFELTVDAKPMQDHYSRDIAALRLVGGVAISQVALDEPRFDRALSDLVYGTIDESVNLFNDLERIRFEARLDTARKVLTASSELRLKGDSSWTAGTIAATTPAAVPATLPRLPPEATLASYNPPMPAERYAPLMRIAGDLAEGFLEHEKLPDAMRKRVRRVTEAWLSKMPEGFMFAMSPGQTTPNAYLRSDTIVMRVSEPSPRLLGLYTDVFALAGDAKLERYVKQKTNLNVIDKLWPKVTKKPFKLAGFKTPATLFQLQIDAKAWEASQDQLPSGLKDLIQGDGFDFKQVAVIVQPDGDSTYVLTGDDPREMTRVMAEHRKATPGAALVKPAHSDKITMAGFATLAYVAHALERNPKTRELGLALAKAPSHGTTPVPFATTVGPGSARLDVELPAALFSDVSAAAVAAGPSLGRSLK